MASTPEKNKEEKNDKSFHKKYSKYDKIREARARIILSKDDPIRSLDHGVFLIKSQSGHGHYLVEWKNHNWRCNCQDFIKNNRYCKHIIARDLFFNGYITIDEEEPEIQKESYSQDWDSYDQAQVNEIEFFDSFLQQLVSTIPEPEQNMGRPRLRISDQIFCCAMKAYSQLSHRRAESIYTQALDRQQISYAPSFKSLSSFLVRPDLTPILLNLVHHSALPLASIENNFAVDSSGFRCSTFSDYCRVKYGINKKHNWLKVHIGTGVQTNIIADVIITDEHAADGPQFKKIIANIANNFKINEVYADAAYSSGENHQIVDKYGGVAYIDFKKNSTGKKGGALYRKAFHYFQLHRDEFERHYHLRSNAESTFSAIKLKFGDSIKSRNRIAQENEMPCKILAYNITVLIRVMFKLGIHPDFSSTNMTSLQDQL
jgi:transposase